MKYFVRVGVALLCCSVVSVFAEKADRNQPMNAEADAMQYNELKQSSVFTGNVVMTKGTTLVRGGRVEVTQDAQGYQQAVVTAAPGALAYYRSKRDLVDEFIEGEGEVIEYDSRADTVKFIRRAVLRRFVGATLADETQGNVIRYDNTTEVFNVDGNAGGSSPTNRTASNPGGRVRAVLSPRNKVTAPAASSSASSSFSAVTPALPGQKPATDLRSSTQLNASEPR